MLKCELRVRISFRPSPNAIMAGRGTHRRASLFAFCRRRLERHGGEGVCLTPWKVPGGLLWLSSSLGLCSTASHLGKRLHGDSEGQGSAMMLECPCLCGICSGTMSGGGESWFLQT